MKKIAVFTGAGIDAESNIPTFRDSNNGMYMDKNIMDMMSVQGWKLHKEAILNFHNLLRNKVKECESNKAHLLLKKLEEKYEVTIITQNVSDLHERAGSSSVYHLHGELMKCRSMLDGEIYPCENDFTIGDMCKYGGQLRPHTVFFGEEPYNFQEAYETMMSADILIIIGTSLEISYTIPLLGATQAKEIYYVDPKPSKMLELRLSKFNKPKIKYIKKKAVDGMNDLYKKLMK